VALQVLIANVSEAQRRIAHAHDRNVATAECSCPYFTSDAITPSLGIRLLDGHRLVSSASNGLERVSVRSVAVVKVEVPGVFALGPSQFSAATALVDPVVCSSWHVFVLSDKTSTMDACSPLIVPSSRGVGKRESRRASFLVLRTGPSLSPLGEAAYPPPVKVLHRGKVKPLHLSRGSSFTLTHEISQFGPRSE
jgi:hypothetical protein